MARKEPRLTGRGLTVALLSATLATLTILTLYATLAGRTHDKPLPVEVTLERRAVTAADAPGGMVTDVVVVRNLADFDLPNFTVDLNGQYFLYRQSPLVAGEEVVLPQQIFATKSNQRFVPGRYPITQVTVTGRLPSGARGVHEARF